MRCAAAALALLLSAPVFAQVNSRPTDPPIVTAENDSWYRLGQPVVVSGEFYYPAGPTVFFDGDLMVRTGHYNGVPLYADATLEPHSVVLVPVGRNLMQPFERIRSGELAGTSGSRAPSFPGRSDRLSREIASSGTPVNLSQPIGAVAIVPERAVGTSGRLETGAPGAIDRIAAMRTPPRRGQPFRYDSVSVHFRGAKWVMAGPSVPMSAGLVQVAEYKGFPVYAEKGRDRDRLYLPLTPGRVAPFTAQR